MLALHILEVKNFMNRLLCSETFDNFLLKEAIIRTNITWNLDGTFQKDFYSSEEIGTMEFSEFPYLPFGQIRSQCFQIIKGKHTPTFFRFVFLLSPTNLARTLEQAHSSFSQQDITGMCINLKFQAGKLTLTTGISYRIFSTDKSLEQEWDSLVRRFLKNHEIVFEEL